VNLIEHEVIEKRIFSIPIASSDSEKLELELNQPLSSNDDVVSFIRKDISSSSSAEKFKLSINYLIY
jgi:hypothetical protein